ncbi:MAG TPA: hypothetical protein VIY48_10995 [Candidatus Paceibacterota bacterium]
MNKHKIEWIPTLPNDGTRWELEIDEKYCGRIIKTGSNCRYSYLRLEDKSAFSINDAGRKLLAHALEQMRNE